MWLNDGGEVKVNKQVLSEDDTTQVRSEFGLKMFVD
jgi:hypothetical protein